MCEELQIIIIYKGENYQNTKNKFAMDSSMSLDTILLQMKFTDNHDLPVVNYCFEIFATLKVGSQIQVFH